MLDILKRAAPVTAASLRDALREIEAKLPEAREALAAATRERADLLLRGSEKEIVAAEARITSARIAVDRYEAAMQELARKEEEAEIAEAEAALDAEHRAIEARAAALAKRIVSEYAKHAGPLASLLQEIEDTDAAIDALNRKLHAAEMDAREKRHRPPQDVVLVPHVEERAISTGPYGVIKNALVETTSLLPMRDGAGWRYGRDYARRFDFKV